MLGGSTAVERAAMRCFGKLRVVSRCDADCRANHCHHVSRETPFYYGPPPTEVPRGRRQSRAYMVRVAAQHAAEQEEAPAEYQQQQRQQQQRQPSRRAKANRLVLMMTTTALLARRRCVEERMAQMVRAKVEERIALELRAKMEKKELTGKSD